uniref:Uncharacterized protein n=1 Tax=Oryza brachyantha TaxID=4533 RepID=J3N4K3_ORYBR
MGKNMMNCINRCHKVLLCVLTAPVKHARRMDDHHITCKLTTTNNLNDLGIWQN